ncbi:hypothetical protein [uncultured Ruminococcus sp.]|uniref:hypothetical protein n=1 Tax=uncultured Ruminococcus sp. TaxID=165186 RepID=UPI0026747DAD|nr:hypothetical protein [uncultured Ruminococcus sp.]
MQKRRIGAMGGFLLAGAVLLSGCSSPVGGEIGAAQKLSGSFTTEMTMNMEEQTVSGTLSRMGDGMWSVSFAEPATLAGVVLDFSGGEVTASYQGLAFSVPQTAMPAKSILSSLILVVDDLAKQEHISGEKDGDYVSVEGELEGSPYLLRLSAGGELAGFEMDNMDTVMTFTDFQEGGVPVATPTETECVSSSETL